MTPALQIALSATPLAAYFTVLGVFNGGSRPRVVSGPVDFGLLTFGVGGLVMFGPFGKATIGRIGMGQADLLTWVVWIGLIGYWSLFLTFTASRRLAIYHASPTEIDKAVGEALAGLGGRYASTLIGFEDAERGSVLVIRASRRLQAGSVEAYGRGAEALIRQLRPRLRASLARFPQRSLGVARTMLFVASMMIFIPVTVFFLGNPRAKEALRALMQSLRWW